MALALHCLNIKPSPQLPPDHCPPPPPPPQTPPLPTAIMHQLFTATQHGRGPTTGEPKCYTWSGHCPFVFDKNDSIFSESSHNSNMIDSILTRFENFRFSHLRTCKKQKSSHRSFIDNDGFFYGDTTINRKNKTVVNAIVL
jgi:hypothetical protein